MNRFSRSYLASALIAFSALSLGASAHAQPADKKASDKKVTIWINGDKGYNGLAKVGESFTKATGVKLTVEHFDDLTGKFQTAAASAKGPDIMCWAHDRLGEWQSGGLVAEVKPSKKALAAIEKKGWDAFTIGGKIYGYPYAFEAIGLVYNKALVKAPPKSFEQIFALHKTLQKDGKKALLWDYNNTYFTFPLLAANDGFAFQRKADGTYDGATTGVNNAGALKGLEMLVKLIKDGVMVAGATGPDAEAGMTKGEIAMTITGPWAWANLQAAKVDYGVAPLPSINGKPSKPFIGVQGCMVNQASGNKDLAVEFLENHMLTPAGLKLINDDKAIGVPANKAFFKQLATDARIKTNMQSVKIGVLMPSNPEMGKFWSAMASALENATQGRQSPKEALDAAAKRITTK
ncbi:MAG: maltose/maltodextrin ABC transporter substrate-binding protein MalE [Myxococcales bacterium]|nr:maltose/maltodextrin ABC transporter substrate-binding protein MalE [Myxococcales bacterium]